MFLPTLRTEGISTSDMITRIVRDYDTYLRRNLARGVPAKELNITFLKQKQLQMADSVQGIRDDIKQELNDWRDEWNENISYWESRSSGLIKGFVKKVFGVELTDDGGSSPEGSMEFFTNRRKRRRKQSDNEDEDGDDELTVLPFIKPPRGELLRVSRVVHPTFGRSMFAKSLHVLTTVRFLVG